MDVSEAISARRSIRRFKDTPLADEVVEKILQSGTLAPSGKNRQPWRFYVVSGGPKKAEMVSILRAALQRMAAEGHNMRWPEHSVDIIERAPVTVFVCNPEGQRPWFAHANDQAIMQVVDTQSVGASIQNMLLAAQAEGVGSLWICDVFIAYDVLCDWLGEKGELIAAISFGYADEAPAARPRKPLSDVTVWVK